MSIKQLIFRNLKKNLKNYYLYVFALIFSVALYFAFVTLQFDPALDEAKGSVKGAASMRAASVLLVAIVSIFLLYANNIFIKRRSQEIGLLQLIGMTKNRIFHILSIENFMLYYSSLAIGSFIGFAASKLIMMILFKITKVETIATLNFSTHALIQTLIVFTVIYIFIMLMNFLFIKKQSILSLFNVLSSSQIKINKVSFVQIIIGIVGICLIVSGYFVSTKLFGGDFSTMTELFIAMIYILSSVIIGTYLFYKGSVTFIFNIIRKQKNGYLTVNEVLSLSSLMFRMKSNALLLTIITTVSALAIGLLSLSYIAYYSAEKSAENYVAADFSMTVKEDAELFKQALNSHEIAYSERVIDVIQVEVDVRNLIETKLEEINFDPNVMLLSVISDDAIQNVDLSTEETIFTGYSDILQKFMSFKDSGKIDLKGKEINIPQNYLGLKKDFVISNYFTNGGLPTAIVDDSTFKQLKNDLVTEIQKESSIYIGITVKNEKNLEKANDIYTETSEKLNNVSPHSSRLNISNVQKKNMGMIMFIVGFLGLTFLITSGCILYFKQMDESEEEKSNYTILRKLGFTQGDLLKGIRIKQLFNFGIPLTIGLLHSYFAVQSGWFLFGTEIWTPMILVMVLYTVLYSIFGLLSILYYKRVIRESLY
ncbi:ABC transporter permease [Aquibacillus rhizosphaerae]|uniref:ABC transporter permease n=1 Tax=Aquibacillus rhizosphaerae TaxID=3051431 RepID=A0ABT7L631_9BACI|nr:ABC transporter permease [Aquibacillus sp. LR5S19]MDL4840859.1 ABC transporter permease [Aquibacillus sp. LR5S19]